MSTIWENELPGGSARAVVTDAAEVITDVPGTVECTTGIETGATAFSATALGLVGGDAVGPVVASKAAAVTAPEMTKAISR